MLNSVSGNVASLLRHANNSWFNKHQINHVVEKHLLIPNQTNQFSVVLSAYRLNYFVYRLVCHIIKKNLVADWLSSLID